MLGRHLSGRRTVRVNSSRSSVQVRHPPSSRVWRCTDHRPSPVRSTGGCVRLRWPTTCRAGTPGWVDLSLSQSGVPARQVVCHLSRAQPPVDLTGLGLWSVQRQTRELGGCLTWTQERDEFTLTVRLPDR